MKMEITDREYIINSALWATYGDALGFITELSDENTLKWRINSSRVEKTIPWKRRIGGKFGVIVDLPAGCYSDDTQLRLATSRAIRGDGKFDVEAFAKIEIPVWLSYALGAGRGSKAAAASLAKKDTAWTNNFYEIKTPNSRYVDNGGNGAAMRIQPHVWASRDYKDLSTFLPNVIRNAICTHGHPRGISGAVFHALCLAFAFLTKSVPRPNDWKEFAEQLNIVSNFVRSDNELNEYWLPIWEKSVGSTIEVAFNKVVNECVEDIMLIQHLSSADIQQHYAKLVKEMGGLTAQNRGSGTKTAIIAAMLAWAYKDDPSEAMKVSANLLGSDTDSIATMAGAILGATTTTKPEGEICDRAYIESEASRLADISNKIQRDSFIYPDLLKWDAPSVQSNIVGVANNSWAVSGLGYASKSKIYYEQQSKQDTVWEWLHLSFGQNILAKHRSKPSNIPLTNLPVQINNINIDKELYNETQEKLFNSNERCHIHSSNKLTFDVARKKVLQSNFDPTVLGNMLLELSRNEQDGVKLATRFSEVIVKEYIAKIKKDKWQKKRGQW